MNILTSKLIFLTLAIESFAVNADDKSKDTRYVL